MKSIYFTRFLVAALLLVSFSFTADAQKQPKSPPQSIMQEIGDLQIDLNYNAPSVKGRKIWGALVPTGQVWRTGANDATTFEINKAVTINGEQLAAGKYSLFTIPNGKEWTFIFNKQAEQWGAYKYKEAQDALRVTAQPTAAPEFTEQMTFEMDATGVVSLLWEDLKVSFTVDAEK